MPSPAFALRASARQPSHASQAKAGGVDRDRTDDLKLAKLALSQLSYDPVVSKNQLACRADLSRRSPKGVGGSLRMEPARLRQVGFRLRQGFGGHVGAAPFAPLRKRRVVGPGGVEPPTSRLSGVRSNHLSYEPLSGMPNVGMPNARRQMPKAKQGAALRRFQTSDISKQTSGILLTSGI
jgi:hypothetical protein